MGVLFFVMGMTSHLSGLNAISHSFSPPRLLIKLDQIVGRDSHLELIWSGT